MLPILRAVAAIVLGVGRGGVSGAVLREAAGRRRAEASRQRVVGVQADAGDGASRHRQSQAMVFLRADRVVQVERPDQNSFPRVLQGEPPALVQVQVGAADV